MTKPRSWQKNVNKYSSANKKRLLNILNKFEYLFYRTLGTCNTAPIDLELKDDAKPVCSQTYPVPRVHEAMFRKEVKILVQMGVLEEANESEWGAPSFAQAKAKTNWIRSLRGFRNLNRQLKRKPYPIPKIRKIFKYATSLDLNMFFYHICLSREISNLSTILVPSGRYKYKRLPTGYIIPWIFSKKNLMNVPWNWIYSMIHLSVYGNHLGWSV